MNDRTIPSPPEPTTLVEAAYQRLRDDIVEGILAPGEKLRVEHLKDRYGVGAGTLREALLRLVSDALVLVQGQRGFRVAPMSLTDFEDITRTRVLLETEALRQSIQAGGEEWEAKLVSAFHLLSRAEDRLDQDHAVVAEWELRNRLFHESLIQACPSRWLLHFQAILYRQSERYRRLSVFRRPIPRDVHAEHQALFEAALRRDADAAAAVLREHILRTLEAVRHMPRDFFTLRP
ncbi:FCD domain-containing protein [Tepidiphilus succinatimandens]|uniref:FCD domain-containing protein n=1 Tax=Tepidiphilus succinatimandens TaxID=224436 RepID=UPI00112F2A68|nr:FCD domain-containing protein [Tepidiphilus succinatimandens]